MKTVKIPKRSKKAILKAIGKHCSKLTLAKANEEFTHVPACVLLEIYCALGVVMFAQVIL